MESCVDANCDNAFILYMDHHSITFSVRTSLGCANQMQDDIIDKEASGKDLAQQ